MTYIKKFLPEAHVLVDEYERDPEAFIRLYSKYTTFLGNKDSIDTLEEILANHKRKA
jgi:hypothetical protein